jgi:uncharacterized RDD family membrane protein YckC
MTQPPEDAGGWPVRDQSPGDQASGSPGPVPPPGSWHFPQSGPPQPQPAQDQPAQDQPAQDQPAQDQPAQDQPAQDQSYDLPGYSTPPPYGASQSHDGQQYGTNQPHRGQPYGTNQPHGTNQPYRGQPYGTNQPYRGQPYGTNQPYGTSQQYGTNQPHGGQSYGTPGYGGPQQVGPPQQYGTASYGPPPPYAAPPPYGTSPYYGTPQYGTPYGPAYPVQATGFPAGPEPGLAEWWRRLLARLIDGLVLTALSIPIAIALFASTVHQFQQIANQYPDPNMPGAQAAISKADGRFFLMLLAYVAAVGAISFLYDAIQHGLWGQTLGKRALGIRVVSAYDRSKITGGMAAGRAAMYALLPLVPLAGSVYSLVDSLWLFGDRRRQCLHDKPAHTIVVRTGLEQPGGLQQGSWQ